MMRIFVTIAVVLGLAAPARGQLSLNLEHLAKNAKETVEITLDGGLLKLAGRFLSAEKPDEAKVKEIVSGLTGIYVRSFEFDRANAYGDGDLDAIRGQIRGPGWARIVRHTAGAQKGGDAREVSEIYVRSEGNRSTGVTIITAEQRELTVVQILGDIDLDKLGELSGQFGIPKLPKQAR